ncbi:Filament-like plant protein [Actinidia chinensis var. chinensis]|uniref:Filament-like plant protein n=1 Tax=Actinidia chinensis var. chinensis TaxID=1590841 RepID=A0A2R6PZM2_ACTCC|nr:Filament-like plant protein [Actinidia chinensis var. chinensis]
MDKRSWPWKKKSSDKSGVEKAVAASESASSSVGFKAEHDKYKKPNYVQISVESYSHLTGLEDQVNAYEDQVKTLEDEVEELNEKLSAAHTEMTNKENLVKQHTKVAEEAVSGWEKAEAEALTLKNHLESVTLLKLTAEDRASHLDGALKECMRQIRNLKEEHEQRLHEVVLTKTKQWDKIKLEFESKIANLDQELLRSAAENAALSRSLQDRSNMLIKISEEKSQAEAEVELLKSNIESCEREINSLKYELHIVAKELEIRNEEKNMSVRSAEVANKQHLDGVKKIAKLEAECQRLRGLVRKKLPGPAALAQMKLEVENLGRDYGETRVRRSSVKPSSPHTSQLPEFCLDNVLKCQKENELLTERLFAVEEETKMLKEALAMCNSELQASRNICAKTVNKLQSVEAQLQASHQQKSPTKSNGQVPIEGSLSQNAGGPLSLTSMSEDGNDDDGSCAGSWATAMISELSHFKKEKIIEKPNNAENANHLELMDDFLEMEKLAYLSNDSNGAISVSDVSNNDRSEIANQDTSEEVTYGPQSHSKVQSDLDSFANHVSSNLELAVLDSQSDADSVPLTKLQSRISTLFGSMSKDSDMEKILDDIRRIVQETDDSLHQHSIGCVFEESHRSDATCESQVRSEGAEVAAAKEISLCKDSELDRQTVHPISAELADAISQIHDFVLVLEKEAMSVQSSSPDGDGLSQKVLELSASFDLVIHSKLSLLDFVLDLSHVLHKAGELHFNILGFKNNGSEINGSDCIDKVALPENKVIQDTSRERDPNGCANFSDSTSDPDIPHGGHFSPTFESNATPWKCSFQEFEQMKLDKDSMVLDLARCTEDLESTKTQLQETEQLLAEVKSQLASAQKLNSLAETQLKCMAESYKSLEVRAEDLQTKVNLLQAKTESLDTELKEERKNLQDALANCKELQEKLQRNESCAVTDIDVQSSQEKELAAAAEKLAECQENIFLLGKQLKSMRPQSEFMTLPYNERSQKGEALTEEEPTTSSPNLRDFDQSEMDFASTNLHMVGGESPVDLYNPPFSPSDTESNSLLRSPISLKHPKHRSTKSGSSSFSAPTPEKHSRGISRFFSSKAKNGY